jgi:hypothetical protein
MRPGATTYCSGVKIAVLTLAGLLVASCQGESGPVPTRFECSSTVVVIGFWPEGHAAISSINAPEARDPHIEIAVDNLEEVFYFDAAGKFIRGVDPCDESSELLPDSPVVDGVEERLAGTLTCSLETEAVIWRSSAGEESAIVAVTASDTTVIRVSLAPDDPHPHLPSRGVHVGPASVLIGVGDFNPTVSPHKFRD